MKVSSIYLIMLILFMGYIIKSIIVLDNMGFWISISCMTIIIQFYIIYEQEQELIKLKNGMENEC